MRLLNKMRKKSFISLSLGILSLLFLINCSTAPMAYKEIPKLEFERTPSYTIDLDDIKKPDAPKVKYGRYNSNGLLSILESDSDINSNDVIIFDTEEYKKIGQVVVLTTTYKNIIKQQEVLINQKIEIENSLKEFVELERLKTKEYADLWVDTVNMYELEKRDHNWDNNLHTVMQVIMTLSIIGLAVW